MRKILFIFLLALASVAIFWALPTKSSLRYQAASANEFVSPTPARHAYYLRTDAPQIEPIMARGYIVADLKTGDVLISKNADKAYPIASLSKLVTALTALRMGLEDQNLLYPLLLESDNEIAEEIATKLDHKTFMEKMNSYAKELGMTATTFKDASGISPHNRSSAKDLFILAKYLYEKYPDLLDITRLPQKTVGDETWVNNNLFVNERKENYLGGKSGYTPEARGTLVSIFAIPLAGDEVRPVAVILLGTDSDKGVKYEVSESIIDYIEKNVYYK